MNKILILKYNWTQSQKDDIRNFLFSPMNNFNGLFQDVNVNFGLLEKPQNIDPYDVIILNLIDEVTNQKRKSEQCHNVEGELYKEYWDEKFFLSQLQNTKSYLFVLNNFYKKRNLYQDSFFSQTILQNFFKIQGHELDWAQTQHIEEINGENNFATTHARFSVKETKINNKSLSSIFKIENTNDIVGWKKNKKYLIPFYEFNEGCCQYIEKEIAKQQPHKTITSENMEKYLKTNWGEPFQIAKLDKLFLEEELIKKQRDEEEEKLKKCQEKMSSFEMDISILNSQGKELETALILFLEKNQIVVHKPPSDNEMDFYFQIKNKFVVVEVKGCEKNKINDKPFGQLLIWRTDLIELLKQQEQKGISDENILEILIINNGYSIHPDERKLTIPPNLKKRHSAHAKVITTINLLRIFERDNGKDFFEKQILESQEMEIKPQE